MLPALNICPISLCNSPTFYYVKPLAHTKNLKQLKNKDLKEKALGNRGFFFILRNSIFELIHLIKITLFENKCKLCENDLVFKEEKHICSDCLISIKQKPLNTCNRCGKSINRNLEICGECLINPPEYKKHLSFSTYEDRLRDLVLKSKYSMNEPLKAISIQYYIETFSKIHTIKFDYIIPVPMDKGRERKYDHVFEITKILSKKLNIELETDNLIKIKRTEPQAGLTMAKRLKNLNGAFKLNNPDKLSNKTVLLIDDVYTTGTTIKKCSAPLIKAGASVYAITLARSV